MPRILLTGATGYVGGSLLPVLLDAGHDVRCLARDPSRADLDERAAVVQADLFKDEGLEEALADRDVAFYLVHSMEGNGAGDFADRDRRAAENFARTAKAAGVARVVYLGGLGSTGAQSGHLRSREEVAGVLRDAGPPLVHVRAAMVVGGGSASFRMLEQLVRRLPVMITPRWIDTRSQPVAIGDVASTLATLVDHPDPPAEVQLGGADVLTYREMMRRFARVTGRRPPFVIPVPVLSPGLSSHWVRLVTGMETGLVRPLVEGLAAEMVVHDEPPAGINDDPKGFDEAVRRAVAH